MISGGSRDWRSEEEESNRGREKEKGRRKNTRAADGQEASRDRQRHGGKEKQKRKGKRNGQVIAFHFPYLIGLLNIIEFYLETIAY